MIITSLHLALSDRCGANCIFCPKHPSKIKLEDMAFELLKKIIDEISSKEFKKHHNIKEIQVSNNGDCFLNKDVIKMLRYIKKKCPNTKVIVFTNFQLFNEELQRLILTERLIDEFNCNIDSMSPDYYKFIKGLDLDKTLKNMDSFVRLRNKLYPIAKLTVYIISAYQYINQLKNIFNLEPIKVKNKQILAQIKDDEKNTANLLSGRLFPVDNLVSINPIFWAERENLTNNASDFSGWRCPHFQEIKESLFVSPEGKVYLCCLDHDYKLSYGDARDNTILEIFNNDKRKELLELISNQDYSKVGLPCIAVAGCCVYKYESKKQL